MTYVENMIAVSMDSVGILEDISQFARLRNDKTEPPSDYHGKVLVKKTVDGEK